MFKRSHKQKIKDFHRLMYSCRQYADYLKSYVTYVFKKNLHSIFNCHFERNEVESKNLKLLQTRDSSLHIAAQNSIQNDREI